MARIRLDVTARALGWRVPLFERRCNARRDRDFVTVVIGGGGRSRDRSM
jgi:hypothetical protein